MLKVVLADDEKKICQLLQVIVNWGQLGCEIVEIVHNGVDALDAVRRHQPEVIVTDIRMPECSGLELLHKIREEKQDIDVVIISGYRQFEYAHAALQDGAEDYLLKPIKKTELISVIERIQARRRNRNAVEEKLEHAENIQRSLELSADKLHTQLLREIISGTLNKVPLARLNEDYHCGFSGDFRCMATVKIDVKELLLDKTSEIMERKMRTIVHRQLTQNNLPNFGIGDGNFLYFLIDVKTSLQVLEHSLYHSIWDILDYAGKLTTLHVTAGVARVENNELYGAVCKSRSAVRDQVFAGTEKILRYHRPAIWVDAAEVVNRKTAGGITYALTQLSGIKLKQELVSVIEEMHHGKTPVQSGENLYEIMAALMQQLIACSKNLYTDDAVIAVLEKYQSLLEMCFSWESYQRLFENMAAELIERIKSAQQTKEKRPIQETKRIIKERFSEPLTLIELGEILQLSPPYLSSLFKSETGVTISQYLTTVRMEEAKRLLMVSGKATAEIAEQVGYVDEKYFMRVFKKEVGLTISAYRQLYG